MNIIKKIQKEIWPLRANYHVLTYAEEGFSPLSIHTDGYDFSKDVLNDYVTASNATDELKTMVPLCNLSMLPRRLIRQSRNSVELYAKLLDFFDLNRLEIKANKIILDFRTHELAPHVLEAILMLKSNHEFVDIEEIVIIEN